MPPITSVNDNKVSSAAGINLEPEEYKIKPKQTKVPCTANRLSFLLVDKILKSVWIITIRENKKQTNPAIATVVNLGVSFFHLKETEKTEKPNAEIKPNNNPIIDPCEKLPNPIIKTPTHATKIAIQTLIGIFSFKNKNPNNAV